MGKINRIKIGDTLYDITPEIGKGLQFGTQLENANTVYVNIGKASCDKTSMPKPV